MFGFSDFVKDYSVLKTTSSEWEKLSNNPNYHPLGIHRFTTGCAQHWRQHRSFQEPNVKISYWFAYRYWYITLYSFIYETQNKQQNISVSQQVITVEQTKPKPQARVSTLPRRVASITKLSFWRYIVYSSATLTFALYECWRPDWIYVNCCWIWECWNWVNMPTRWQWGLSSEHCYI